MDITLQEIVNTMNDHIGNYVTSTLDPGQRLRQANRSIEYVKRRFGFPSDEKMMTINFCEDQYFYDVDEDFDESLLVKYQNNYYNRDSYRWDNLSYIDLYRQIGNIPTNKYAFTTINGRKQIMMVGRNIFGGEVLEEFETLGDWTDEADASSLALDGLEKYSGDYSFAFDINNVTGTATLRVTGLGLDLTSLFEKHGFIKLWAWMTDDNIDDVSIKLYSASNKYYTIVVDTTDDGSDFSEAEWIKLGFAMDDAVATNGPDYSAITQIDIEFDLGAGFTSAVDFRVDHMFTVYPDALDLVYYSAYKGTDTTGATQKIMLTEMTDIVTVCGQYPDTIDIIARHGAIALWRPLKGDLDALADFRKETMEMMKGYTRTFPRKRTQNNAMTHKLRRS